MVDLGIDFGTTRTVVAACDRGNYPVVGFQLAGGETLDWYPSVVAEKDGELFFGLDALGLAGATVVRSFKRFLSDPLLSPATKVEIGSVRIEIIDLVTRFLTALKKDLTLRSNMPGDPSVMRCVVATPANSHSTQRFITLESFRRAGYEVAAILNEPSAAGLEYAHRYKTTITAKRENILVYDLGGGTFDASLVRMSGKSHDVVASTGLARLGGDDFDLALFELVKEARPDVDPGVLEQCREAKERLTPSTKRIPIEVAADDLVNIPVDKYYAKCAPLVRETFASMKRVLAGDDEIAGVYVVGGASALPVIARMLKEEYGRKVHRSAHPSGSIAIGLAIASDARAGYEVSERYGHHFGVFREAKGGAFVAFDPIFGGQTEQPSTAKDEANVLVRTYRAAHNVGHFRYIECGWLDPSGVPSGDITPFAEVFFPFDPKLQSDVVDLRQVAVERTGPGALVEERYFVQPGGIVELAIKDLETGYERRHRL